MRRVACVAGAVLAFCSFASAADAVVSTYSFNLQNNNTTVASRTNAGNTLTFQQSNASGGPLTMTASAWNANLSGGTYTITQATLGQYVGGLGVTSAYDDLPGSSCGPGGCDTHQIDNFGNAAYSSSIDFVQLQFDRPVTLADITRYAYGSYSASLRGTVYDDDFSYLKGSPVANNTKVSASAFNAMFDTNVANRGGCTVVASVGACVDTAILSTASQANASTASNTWFIGASTAANYGGDGVVDGFKLAKLDVYAVTPESIGAVPEPASWAMMVIGFGAAGTALRRRQRQARARAA